MTQIRTIHHSLRGTMAKGYSVRPGGMERMRMPREMADGLTEIAVAIFTDCVNVGTPFQDALLAIYLSGLEHGHAIMRERNNEQY